MNISFVSVANYISPFVDINNLPETLIQRRQTGVTSNILLIQWPCYQEKRNNIALDILLEIDFSITKETRLLTYLVAGVGNTVQLDEIFYQDQRVMDDAISQIAISSQGANQIKGIVNHSDKVTGRDQ